MKPLKAAKITQSSQETSRHFQKKKDIVTGAAVTREEHKNRHLHIKSHKQYSTNYRKDLTALRNKKVKSYQSLLDNIELTLSLFSSLITAAFPLTAPNTPITHDCTLHTTESGLYELMMSIRPYE